MHKRRTIWQASQQIAAGQLRASELVEACLAQIAALDDRICAWVSVDREGARRQAEQLDREQRTSHVRGALHGIPIGVKDIFDVAGWPTRAGSPLRADHVAERDAAVVRRLREAGAIVLGKTVTTEFACFDPPPTRNPWNLAHTPGGSSSGSAAAVATGMCLAAIGSQTGGSITRPAAYCGVCGYKPTWGLASVDGVVPFAFHLDHPGPIATSARDLMLLCEIVGYEECDPLSVAAPEAGARDTVVFWSDSDPGPRIGLLGGYFRDAADADVRSATGDAIDRLRPRGPIYGARISQVEPPASFAEVHAMHRLISAVEAAEYHRQAFLNHRDSYGPRIAQLIDEGLAAPAVDYAHALLHRFQFQRDMLRAFGDCDVLVAPATATAAPARLDTTGDPGFNSPWSYAGLPTVSIPCGLTRAGMPVALQLIGRPFDDGRTIAAAVWCEDRIEFDARPPMMAGA